MLDLGWEDRKVGLDHDGRVHETRFVQDRRRRRDVLAAGWTSLESTDEDHRVPTQLQDRVRQVLGGSGLSGPTSPLPPP